MKSILILISSLILISCDEPPKFPGIKDYYLFIKEADKDFCFKYEILSIDPITIGNRSEVDSKECNLVAGFKPEDSKKLFNWIDEIHTWILQNKGRCK